MTVTAPSLPRYPDGWPIPQRNNHSGIIDAGLVRSAQDGFPQQFRFTSTAPTRMAMVFRIAAAEWTDWVTWINTYAINRWCLLPCVDQHQRIDPTPTYDWSIARFTGRIRRRPIGETFYDAQCEVDIWPYDIGVGKPNVVLPAIGVPPLAQCVPYACDSFEDWLTGDFNLEGGFSPRFGVAYATETDTTIQWPWPGTGNDYYVWATIGGTQKIVTGYSGSSSIREIAINPYQEHWQECVDNELTHLAEVNASNQPFLVEAPMPVSVQPIRGAYVLTRRSLTDGDQQQFTVVLGTINFQIEMYSVFTSNPVAGLTRQAFTAESCSLVLKANSGSNTLELILYNYNSGSANSFKDANALVVGTLDAANFINKKFCLVTFTATAKIGETYESGGFFRADASVDYTVTIGGEDQGLSPTTYTGNYKINQVSSGGTSFGRSEGEGRLAVPDDDQQRNVYLAKFGPSQFGWEPGTEPSSGNQTTYPAVNASSSSFYLAFASIDGGLGADTDDTIRIPWLRNYSSYVLPPEC